VSDESKLSRMQAVLTALLKHRLDESLEHVDKALQRWREGELGSFETHAEVLKHAARAQHLASRVAQVNPNAAANVLRDAFDAELIGRDEFVSLTGIEPDEVEPLPPLDAEPVATPPKREFVEELLGRGAVLLHIDARDEAVRVPDHLRGDPKLVLRFGYGLSPAIVDLDIDEEGISGTLTFGGSPFHCVLPWSSIYATVSDVDQQAMVWPDDVPTAVLESLQESAAETAAKRPSRPAPPAAKPQKKRPSHLKLVD